MSCNRCTHLSPHKHTMDILTEHDVYLFREGSHFRAYEKLGAHLSEENGRPGTRFRVWAPNARAVSVFGDFNAWNPDSHPLTSRGDHSGIWEAFVAGVGQGALYKYRVVSRQGEAFDKSDPYAFRTEKPPLTASVVWHLDHAWQDGDWMQTRGRADALDAPMSIYEVHLGSWR